MANTSRHYLRCPCCGRGGARTLYTRGALGHPLEALRQDFVTKGTGDSGGAVVWSRRPLNRGELEHIGRALTTALAAIADRLDGNVPIEPPEDVFASIEDDVEAVETGDAWLAEAADEYQRRRAIVVADRERRGIHDEDEQ